MFFHHRIRMRRRGAKIGGDAFLEPRNDLEKHLPSKPREMIAHRMLGLARSDVAYRELLVRKETLFLFLFHA